MSHVNRQIRDAAKAGIEALGFTSVSTNRSTNIEQVDLPHVVLGTGDDEIEETTKDGHEQRVIALTAVIAADGESDTLDDDLDALRVTVEKGVRNGLLTLIPETGLTPIEHYPGHTGATLAMMADEEGDRWFAFYTLSWEVRVWTSVDDPETIV